MWLFIMFVAVPIIEIGLFIEVGGAIGLWPTLGIVILTAFVGTAMMRQQGTAALARLQSSFGGADNPISALADGAMILVAGVLLLTPGFFTDAFGLLLLIPPARAFIRSKIGPMIAARMTVHSAQSGPTRAPSPGDPIETDYVVVSEDKDPDAPPAPERGWHRPSKSDPD